MSGCSRSPSGARAEQPPVPGNALQDALATIVEDDARSRHEVGDGARHEHLARPGERAVDRGGGRRPDRSDTSPVFFECFRSGVITTHVVTALALDGNNPDIVYMGTDNCGLFKGNNPERNGNGWSISQLSTRSDVPISALAATPDSTMYAFDFDNFPDFPSLATGLFKTTDAGGSWTPMNDIPPDEQTPCTPSLQFLGGGAALAFDRADPDTG